MYPPTEENSSQGIGGASRDDVEGTYTQKNAETPKLRKVHGQYTEEEGHGPDAAVEGTYIGAQRDGKDPLVRDARTGHGNYPKAEH
jgi:hypothetical protein